MTGLIGALRVTLGADTANFEKGMKRARTEMSSMQKASTALKTAFAGMIGLLAFDQFATLAKSGLEYASSLGEVATQLGVSTRALQEYRYAASQAGIEQGEMDKALAQLTRRLGAAASGAKAPSEALKRLGVDLRDAKGNIIDAGEAIPLIAEGLKNIESPAERAKILVDLFGKAGQQLAPLLADGAAGVNSLRDAAHSLGVVLSEDEIQKADETADKLAAMKQVLEAKIASSVAQNADAILVLVDALVQLAAAAGNAITAWNRWRNASEQNAKAKDPGYTGGLFTVRPATPERPTTSRQVPLTNAFGQSFMGTKRLSLPKGGRGGGRIYDTRRLDETRNGKAFESIMSTGQSPGAFAAKAATDGLLRMAQAANDVDKPVAAVDRNLSSIAGTTAPKATEAVKKIRAELDELRRSTQGIFDRLFPDEADARQYAEEIGVLNDAMAKGQISANDHARAITALRREYSGFTAELKEASTVISQNFGPTLDDISDTIADRLPDALGTLAGHVNVTKVEVVKTFGDMARETLGELDRLSSAIRGGGFLDILSGVIGLGLQLGGAGLFGKSIQKNILSVPGRAFGGPVMANQPYIVGERRAELFVPSSSGRIEPNPGSGRRAGGDTYHFSGNLLTPEWWAQIQKGFDEAAVRGAMGGANMVAERSQKQARSRLGRR